MRALILLALLATTASAQGPIGMTPDGQWVIYAGPAPTPSPTPTPTPTPVPTPTPSPTPVPTVPAMALGINLAPESSGGQTRAFGNLMAGSPIQISRPTGYIYAPDAILNANGDPVTLATGEQVVRQVSIPNAVYGGATVDVTCKWLGKATSFQFQGAAVSNPKYAANGATFTFKPVQQPVSFMYGGVDPADPVRQIDCREVGYDPSVLFDPAFIASLKPYSVVRFMDWQSTNDNKAITWATRNRPGNGRYRAKDGIPLEYMIALANQTGVNPWFNVPWNADADYVQRMATLIRDTLDPKLKVHVEVSNEVWNYKFNQTNQAQTEGAAAGLGALTAKPLTAVSRYSQKLVEVMTVWETVFAGQQSRLVRIAATQNASYTIGVILKFPGTLSHIDAVAVAPYFGGSLASGALATQAQIDALLDTDLPAKMDAVLKNTLANKKLVSAAGKRFIAYESGQHVISPDVAQFKILERDPRMGGLYTRYLTAWKAQFGDLMVLFNDTGPVTQYGSWGHREYPGQTDAPKANAIDAFSTK